MGKLRWTATFTAPEWSISTRAYSPKAMSFVLHSASSTSLAS
jgi:hypothetical protein